MTALQLQILALCADKRMTTRELCAQLNTGHKAIAEAIGWLNTRLDLGSTRGTHSTTSAGLLLLRSFKAMDTEVKND